MTQDTDLDAIEARANAATAGPWYWEPETDEAWPQGAGSMLSKGKRTTYTTHDGTERHYDAEVVGSWGHDAWGTSVDDADAEFIAHAREDVPALIAEVRRLREELSKAQPHEHEWHPMNLNLADAEECRCGAVREARAEGAS